MEELPRSDGWEMSSLLIDAERLSPLWVASFPRQVVQDHTKKRRSESSMNLSELDSE